MAAIPPEMNDDSLLASSFDYVLPVSEMAELFECEICMEPLVDPVVEPGCRKMFCRRCVASLTRCPNCRRATTPSVWQAAPLLVEAIVGRLRVQCRVCSAIVPRESMRAHTESCRQPHHVYHLRFTLTQLYEGCTRRLKISQAVRDPATGALREEAQIHPVVVRAGTEPGARLVLQHAVPSDVRGSDSALVVVVQLEPDARFTWGLLGGGDLVCSAPRPPAGQPLVLQTLSGRTLTVPVPGATGAGGYLAVPGEGMPLVEADGSLRGHGKLVVLLTAPADAAHAGATPAGAGTARAGAAGAGAAGDGAASSARAHAGPATTATPVPSSSANVTPAASASSPAAPASAAAARSPTTDASRAAPQAVPVMVVPLSVTLEQAFTGVTLHPTALTGLRLTVVVPRGVRSRTSFPFDGPERELIGQPVRIAVTVEPHARFVRTGNDLELELATLDISQSGHVVVEDLNGSRHRIGVEFDRWGEPQLTIAAGLGMPHPERPTQRGDLIIRFHTA